MTARERPATPRGTALLTTLSALAWSACFLAMGQPYLLPLFGAVSLLVIGLLLWRLAPLLSPLLANVPRDGLIGVGVGIGMAVCTYPSFSIAREVWPGLQGQVAQLYDATLSSNSLAVTLLFLAIAGAAEEILWRGAVVEALAQRLPRSWAALIALLLYGLAQALSGSWVIVVLGLSCGAIWTAMRVGTRGLVAPVLAHLVWSGTVLAIAPVGS